jgi:flagellar M-ring protein FliF
MDFLNRAVTQVADLLKSMTPGARITAGLLLGVLVVSLAWLVKQETGGPDDYLLGGQQFSAADVNAMEMAFGQAGLNGYTLEANRIRVPRGQRAAYMAAIADGNALPDDFGTALRKTLEKGGPFITKTEREERLKVATQEELALWIRSMPGIEKAAVAYDVKKKPGLSQETIATASVSVKATGNRPLEESRIRGIRNMVASAISQLSPENVVVTDLVTSISHRASGPGGGGDDALLAVSRSYEQEYRRQIENALAYVPGAQISVVVTLDPVQRQLKKELEYKKEVSVLNSSQEETVDETRESTGPGGVAGARSNTSASTNAPATVAKAGNNSTVQKSSNKQNILPGGVQTTSETLGLQPRRVTVAVSVPKSYFERLWRKRGNIDAAQKADENQIAPIEVAEVQKIRELIAPLLPIIEGVDPIKPIAVKIFDDLPVDTLPEPSFATGALAWLGNYWSTLGMVFLGGFALLVLRSTVKGAATSASANEPAPALAIAPETVPEEPDASADPAAKKKARTLRRREPGMSLKDELTELIREDPDAAAAVLKSWIGTAG